ncbi:hypothetical protein [Gimesia fumaroli]|uniref:Uncharacterized protein n=1 Tax=Gimesia fumaroli TaxID=2527976 RepID=A0A518IFB6_9PLAN|nr:hypothetical protein [Gimesia fumaroli]QDV51792.1 hypothetical protein Enr17x_38510 [Gimesia fumaroli]
MAEKYFVECDCGKRVRVALHEAGTDKACHSCDRRVRVPDSITLQESSGDPYPLLRPLEKISRTVQNQEPPFDGLCHHCEEVNAVYETPVQFNVLVKREMDHDGGIRPTITGGIKLEMAAATEFWEEHSFSLLLCTDCYHAFESDRSQSRFKKMIGKLSVAILLMALLIFVLLKDPLFAAVLTFCSLIGLFISAIFIVSNQKVEPYVIKWLSEIRWFSDAFTMEDEYTLTMGETHKIK